MSSEKYTTDKVEATIRRSRALRQDAKAVRTEAQQIREMHHSIAQMFKIRLSQRGKNTETGIQPRD